MVRNTTVTEVIVCLRSATSITHIGLHLLDTWSGLKNAHQVIVHSNLQLLLATGALIPILEVTFW